MARTGLTIEEATKDFLSKTKWKQSTLARYSIMCKSYIVPYFKEIELTNENINNFIEDKLKNGGLRGKPLSPKTVNDMASLLLQIARSYWGFNLDIEKPSCKQNEINIFTETEYNKLKAYLSIGTDNKKLGIIIVMLTGIRIGELCALQWRNIDLENGCILINKTMQRIKLPNNAGKSKTKIIIDTPKSNASIRTIPIPSILLDKLREFKTHEDAYILTNTKKYIEPRTYQRHFKNYLAACGIKENKFHTLRHTFATMAITREVDIKTVSVLLGHTDVGFTMKRYVHPNMEHRRMQIEKMAIGFYLNT